MGELEEALKCFKKAIAINPMDSNARIHLENIEGGI
ncbi:tetratricopeptide repeat protein [Methanobacterium subterraneum]